MNKRFDVVALGELLSQFHVSEIRFGDDNNA